MTKQDIPLGLHFGLDEDAYHADDAIGSTRIKALCLDPYEAQFELLNPKDEDSEPEYLLWGKGLHARVLEGREVYEQRFIPEFDPVEAEGALVTVSDLQSFLTERGVEFKKSAKKSELIQLCTSTDRDVRILDVMKQQWAELAGERTVLKAKSWAGIEVASEWMQQDPLLNAIMEDGAFIEGAPEVSIILDIDGVRCKARYDRLLRHAVVDLKSFSSKSTGTLQQQAVKAIDRQRYDLQEAWYRRLWHEAKRLHDAGELDVYGEPPYASFLSECFDRESIDWIWVFVKSTGAPQPLVVHYLAEQEQAIALATVEDGVRMLKKLTEEYGADQYWPPNNKAFVFQDADIKPWMFGGQG